MGRYKEIDLRKVKTHSIRSRKSKVETGQFARPHRPGASFNDFLDGLPHLLSGREMRELIGHIVRAKQDGKPVLLMMGAHVIKTGLNPVLIDLMEAGVLDGLAMNGAGAVHDTELAYFGRTSEDVAEALSTGEFGMARETGELLNLTIQNGREADLGFGEAMGKKILEDNPEFSCLSLLAQAYRLNIPATVHVALGTDIVHQHPHADGAAIGTLSLRDFRIFSEAVSRLHGGGVALLFGSAVILPEVFLKALTVARNVHGAVTGFYTASFDMIRHYRPGVNVVGRPTQEGGRGFEFTGQHELLIPLFAAALREALAKS
ncbi:MAG TPA: hypothetical protein ENN17_13135 [bacterium]|nr:hypothetical protein [bacterium]